ncbi:hypothetical protein RAC89_06610 [Paenibacillus sp. GD4]|jgi:hypothetical protein|uniref:hypothetical protein n=1 Tax=Paenibacillus sp. GD4 TaxID=3068890 RepID=UPI002796D358|nr:hypothetical protein [Paenibacillus sp. GD4]MDQ1910169.1 hypothetical protein [Paenibacillus sp. GD4]
MEENRSQDGFIEEDKHVYTDLATVESQRNDLTAEEFPEGPYGSSLPLESLGKSTPWRESQRSNNRFTYEDREFHAGRSREYPGDHPTHDSSGDDQPH